MDVRNLLVFVKVAQAGSFTAAAKLLRQPKSTVSRQVADLEAELGVSLLVRTTRSLKITDLGQVYLRQGLRIASEIDAAEAMVSDLQSIPQGCLRITAPVEFGSEFLATPVDEFLRANRKVSVDLVMTERVVDLVAEGFDLAIRIGELADSSLMAKKLGSLDLQLFASPEYLKRSGLPETCGDLERHSCIRFTGDDTAADWELSGPKGKKTVKIDARISANNLVLVRDFATRGLGIARLPAFFCMADVKSGRLRPVLKDWVSGAGAIHAVYPGTRYLLPKTRAFLEHLERHFRAQFGVRPPR